jgi:hypothetical protein
MYDEPMDTQGVPASGKSDGRKEIEGIRIEPAKNGGHTVRHNYKSRRVYRKAGPNAGMGTEYVEPEEFVFGPDDNEKMLAHVAKYLGLKAGKAEREED